MTLSEYLKETGETQEVFGARIGVPQGTVTKYVTGRRIPRPRFMARIIEATNGQVSASDFYPPVDFESEQSPVVPAAMSNHRRETGSCPTVSRPRAADRTPKATA